MSPRGFKILLELIVVHPNLRTLEVPFEFGARHEGESKTGTSVGAQFIRQLFGLRVRTIRHRFN